MEERKTLVTPGEGRPTLLLLATGGTIAGQGAPGEAGHYTPGCLSAEALLAVVPGLEQLAHIQTQQLCNVNSDDITAGLWLELARKIEEKARDPQIQGFVITHGTDTLEETAWFLQLALATEKPVVLTGSMRPATARSADGVMNLYEAVAVATSPAAWGRGVLTVLSGHIYSARWLHKGHTQAIDAFRGSPELGWVQDDTVRFYQQADARGLRLGPLPDALTQLPRVELLTFAVDGDPELISWAGSRSAGLVIAGAGGGEYSLAFQAQIAALAPLPVIRASRVPEGPVYPNPSLDTAHVFPAYGLSPLQARILLQLALAQNLTLPAIRRLLAEA